MKSCRPNLLLTTAMLAGLLGACAEAPIPLADSSASLRTTLDRAGYVDISASQDRYKGIVTLRGHVAAEADKARAESIVRDVAGTEAVVNRIALNPSNSAGDAQWIDPDKDIELNLSAALRRNNLSDSVKYTVKNYVVTLTGKVSSQRLRRQSQDVAASVPNVEQVVNELHVRNRGASSSRP